MVSIISPRCVRPGGLMRRFAGETSGVAAVEFALVLPFVFMLYIGVVETTQFYGADRKAVVFSRTLSDLTSQPQPDLNPPATSPTSGLPIFTDTSRANVFGLATATLFPFAATNAAMRITQFAIDNNGGAPRAFVDWQETCTWDASSSCTYGPNPLFSGLTNRCDIDPSLGVDLLTPNSYLIRGEVSYHYTPIMAGLFASSVGGTDGYFNFFASGGLQLFNVTYSRPRSNQPIIRVYADGSSTAFKADKVTPDDIIAHCPQFRP